MDCSLAGRNSLNGLDESIKNLTQLGSSNSSGRGSGGSSSGSCGGVVVVGIVEGTSGQCGGCEGGATIIDVAGNRIEQSGDCIGVGVGGNSCSSPLKGLNIGDNTLAVKLRKYSDRCLQQTTTDGRSHTYRISMANLEETQESELDMILGELSLLEAQNNCSDTTATAAATTVFLSNNTGGHGTLTTTAGAATGMSGLGGLGIMPSGSGPPTRTHSRTNSTISGATTSSESGGSTTHSSASSSLSENSGSGSGGSSTAHSGNGGHGGNGNGGNSVGSGGGGGNMREPRTESPDNDSAFSDTVSLMSSESSASSSASSAMHHKQLMQQQQQHHLQYMQQKLNGGSGSGNGGSGGGGVGSGGLGGSIGSGGSLTLNGNNSKAAKIQLALHKLESASIRRLFVKAFTSDGASKSLLVDERMNCGHVTRLLADKNHVQMQPHWALVENLGDLQMERLFEDHELLVDNLMTWNSDAGNRVLFQQRADKVSLFVKPEIYLPGPQMAPGSQHDEFTRSMLVEEFFETNSKLQVDGPLYMKADSKKGWKRYHFVLRSSGLYYFPKEKTKNTRDLACLTLFNGYNVYRGLGWKKKWKAPTEYTFGFKSAVDSSLGKTCRTLRMLCAEDLETMEKWMTAIRISKYGKQLWENHKSLMEDLSGDGISNSSFAVSMRSESISSISSATPSQCGSVSSAISSMSNSSSGRMSRASSSSSSGCLSDDNNGFDSEFTTGTIKRKPSMKPNLPLTTMTRQLKEVGEITICESGDGTDGLLMDAAAGVAASPDRNGGGGGSGTLTRRHSRRKSQESNGSGTLKRRQPMSAKRGSAENMNINNGIVMGLGMGMGMGMGIGMGVVMGCNPAGPTANAAPTTAAAVLLCQKQIVNGGIAGGSSSDGGSVLNCMSSSTLSLDSLPPPPPPPPISDDHEIYGSQLSLSSLPPPPPPEEAMTYVSVGGVGVGVGVNNMTLHGNLVQPVGSVLYKAMPGGGMGKATNGPPPAVPAKPIRPVVKAPPPYKSPPDYVGTTSSTGTTVSSLKASNSGHHHGNSGSHSSGTGTGGTQKKVSFADSPVLLRRKMCSPEPPRSPSTPTPTNNSMPPQFYSSGPMPAPPPRADGTRLSNCSSTTQEFGSPKRLQESASNPPRDFLKDLQRVMRKKWQVAQKCKLEPATTPHEVLGFRDFSDELLAHNLNTANAGISSHYYRETANVSNWVQEHYGAGAPPPPPSNEYALYENLHSGSETNSNYPMGMCNAHLIGLESQFPAQRKKRPPPPPPKRSDSTQLTHRV